MELFLGTGIELGQYPAISSDLTLVQLLYTKISLLDGNNVHKKYSDWLRAVQFKGNTSAN